MREAGLAELVIAGDGNCQFRALSDQLYRTPDHHSFVRALVSAELRANRASYENYVLLPSGPGSAGPHQSPFDAYVAAMARDGEWGDNVVSLIFLPSPSIYANVLFCLICARLRPYHGKQTLQAAANAYGVRIAVLTSFSDDHSALISIDPAQLRSSRCLSFVRQYNVVFF